ncbi:hypothetical protein SAMN05421810_10838 [Amycolatopsis arida]|uniref:Uncharacterized protein n=1 Tax=Amycolatopsis arida TaxID=587909 RepID=A0A1I5YX23_9PSEU|nr:hypothetical protein [Amycolatopsis arida]TDX89951.1 hypothetical protein CLV69_10838 [Amycolatopsis arida]SFQ48762.1 hypothetical protein SAMN05421810_10838 [Amycolatopsis arida]
MDREFEREPVAEDPESARRSPLVSEEVDDVEHDYPEGDPGELPGSGQRPYGGHPNPEPEGGEPPGEWTEHQDVAPAPDGR